MLKNLEVVTADEVLEAWCFADAEFPPPKTGGVGAAVLCLHFLSACISLTDILPH